ncbi:DHA2 family multidrug resistance protein-like MFS transporter [Pseudonocardia endophytica]|uniref:DHA2 family multidrug resistance protein-like MFS transporter n=1 Tax=Pseudonocardia endophytica TaxID=401976 RepID=A0A4R1HJC3_PSEEN|nr:MFS transporter [Pseudonocardia endophytica]TCK22444.1 DHA2 family multidrug resistance protein-like MFS transporter [Pseudonocardia endophytica]
MSARAGRREWLGLVVLVLPAMIVGMDLTVLHLAVPTISEDLAPSSSQLLWIIDIYGFVIAGLLIVMGKLGDRIGRRRLLLVGAVAFALASVLAAWAPTAGMLILARGLLGVAGATVAPSTLSLIRNMFADEGQRTRAASVWMMGNLAGNAAGPLVGGLLLEWFWWGSVFLIGVPVMVLLLVAGPRLVPEYRERRPGRIDPVSAVLSLVAVLGVIYGVQRSAEDGFDLAALAAVVLGVAVGIAFLVRQRRLEDPMLDLELLAGRRFVVAMGVLLLGSLLMAGTGYFGMQFLQLVEGQSTFASAMWSLPLLVAGFVGVSLTPTIAARVQQAYVMAGGLVVAAVGFAVLSTVPVDGGLPGLIVGFVFVFLGLGPSTTLGVAAMVGSAPPERSGAASAMSETSQQFGNALGLAAFGTIGAIVYRSQLTDAMPAGIPADAVRTASDTLGGAASVAGTLPGPLGTELFRAAREAFAGGLHAAATITLVVSLAVAVAVAFVLREPGTPGGHDTSGPDDRDTGDGDTEDGDTDAFGRDDVPAAASSDGSSDGTAR